MDQQQAEVWNHLAETRPLRTEWAKQMFPLPEEMMAAALEKERERLRPELGEVVTEAYLAVMPLLWEAPAILAAQATGHYLVENLQALETVPEALVAASRDYRLTVKEQKLLERKLRTAPV
jgi:hypothetical protein